MGQQVIEDNENLVNVGEMDANQAEKIERSKVEQAKANEEGDAGGAEGKLAQRLATLEADNTAKGEALERATRDSAAASAYVQQLISGLASAANNGDEGAKKEVTDLRERFQEDPEGVLNELFQARVGPLAETYANNQTEMNRQMARERIRNTSADDKEIFDKYEKEVNDFMSNMPPTVRIQPGAYERAYKFIQAEHLDDVIAIRSKTANAVEANARVEAPSGAGGRSKGPAALSDVEKKVAQGLGISEDDYAKFKEVG